MRSLPGGHGSFGEDVEGIRRGMADEGALSRMAEIVETMRLSSLCPLGQSLALPVRSALENFREEFLAHLAGQPCPACEGRSQ